MSHLFTFIMDYKGGTYISQVEADDEIHAMDVWIIGLETKEIEGFSKSDKRKIIESGFSEHDLPLPITGMRNVLCFDIKTKKGFAIVNIVKTDIRYIL